MPVTRSVGRHTASASASASATVTSATATTDETGASCTTTTVTGTGTDATTTLNLEQSKQPAANEPMVAEPTIAAGIEDKPRSKAPSILRSKKTSKSRRLAEARAELARLKVELAAARVQQIEADSSTEDDDNTTVAEIEQELRVHTWLQNSQLLAIDSEPHQAPHTEAAAHAPAGVTAAHPPCTQSSLHPQPTSTVERAPAPLLADLHAPPPATTAASWGPNFGAARLPPTSTAECAPAPLLADLHAPPPATTAASWGPNFSAAHQPPPAVAAWLAEQAARAPPPATTAASWRPNFGVAQLPPPPTQATPWDSAAAITAAGLEAAANANASWHQSRTAPPPQPRPPPLPPNTAPGFEPDAAAPLAPAMSDGALAVPPKRTEMQQLAAAITNAVQAAQVKQTRYVELPFFNGDHQEWLTFRASYEESVNNFSKLENMSRLRRSLRGTAREAVQGLLITNADPDNVMRTLEIRFGRPESIATAEMERLRTLPRLSEAPRDTCMFATKISNAVNTLRALRCMYYMYNPEIARAVVEKLTPTLKHKWYEFAALQPREEPDLLKLERFIHREAEICSPYATAETVTERPRTNQTRQKVFNTAATPRPNAACIMCEKEGHAITECYKFKNLTIDQRWDAAKKHRACFRCLRRRTQQHTCKTKKCGIDGCEHPHHQLLHSKRSAPPKLKEDAEEEKVNSTWASSVSYLKIAPVQVSGPAGVRDTYALLDDGSTVTLIDQGLADDIGAVGPDDPLRICTYDGNTKEDHSSRRVKILLRGKNRHNRQIQARTVPDLRLAAQKISPEAISNCPHLKGITNTIITDQVIPKILIGQDNWHLLIATRTRSGRKNQPVASLTPLGWVVHGSRTRTLGHQVNFVGHTSEENMEKMVAEYITTDNTYLNPKRPENDPEQKALRILEANTTQLPGGGYQTALLWKSEEATLPDNHDNTLRRLHDVERETDRNPLLEKGYAEPAPAKKMPGRTRYSPHLTVVDALKPDKLRVETPSTPPPSGKERVNVICTSNQSSVIPDVTRFSSWTRYLRATARVLQAVAMFRRKIEQVNYKRTKRGPRRDPDWRAANTSTNPTVRTRQPAATDKYITLTAEYQIKAEKLITKNAQEEAFKEELKALRAGKEVGRHSRLHQLSVRLEDDIIVLKSRINAATGVPEEVKTPPVIDGNHRATQLWILHVHRTLHHAGVEATVNQVKQYKWVVRLRPTVKMVLSKCQMCRARAATPPRPATGDLPTCRLAHHQRPFTYTGLDYFGPLTVTVGRSTQKRYVALFTCLTVRAVHLEVVSSLSTESAIMALRRMIARRGCPTEIWSDNATNFHGADAEIRQTLLSGAKKEASKRTITWKFIPPGAPFMGGAWERLVRSVKTALTTVLHQKSPNEETLHTLLTEVELTLNSRPLTHVSVDPADPESLTPSHFLLGGQGHFATTGLPADHTASPYASLRATQALADAFWARWLKEYLPELRNRREPHGRGTELRVGDLVRVVDNNLPRNTWVRGRICATYPGPDGVIRTIDVATRGGVLRRPSKKIVVIQSVENDESPCTP